MSVSTNLSSSVFIGNSLRIAVLRRCNIVVDPLRSYCSSFTSVVTMSRSISQDDQLPSYYARVGQQPRNPPLPPEEEMRIDIVEYDYSSTGPNFEAENSALSFAKAGLGLSRANEILLGITGQASMCLMGIYISGISFPPALYYVVGSNAVGFVGTLSAIFLREKRRQLAGVLAKVGNVGAVSATLVASGMFLPVNFIWTAGVALVVSTFAVACS